MQDIVPAPEQTSQNAANSSLIDTMEGQPNFFLKKKERPEEDRFDMKTLVQPTTHGKRFWWIVGGVSALIVVIFLVINSVFASATVVVTPKQDSIAINTTIRAQKIVPDGQAGLHFQVISLEETSTKEITSTGTSHIERNASGQILVYNNYDKQSLRLVKNTRFETPDGKIYRTKNAIVIPGQHTEGGKLVAGSVEVTVSADQPGSSYNIELTDFTIPGLKSDPRATLVYGRSKTAMTGGFAGDVKVVAPADLANARKELEAQLSTKLQASAKEKLPEDSVFWQNTSQITFKLDESANAIKATDKANLYAVKEIGTLYGITLVKKEVSQYLAKEYLPNYAGQDITISNISDLKARLRDESLVLQSAQDVTFDISGQAKFIWSFDKTALRDSLRGIRRANYTEILKKFPTILDASATLRPFWRMSFPTDPAKIKVETKI